MSSIEAYRNIAKVIKTHGRRGEVVVAARRGLPSLVCAGMSVALVPPALKGPRWYTVRTCTGEGDSRLVGFEGVSDLEASSKLVGRSVLVRVEDLPDDLYLHDALRVMGREVCDASCGSLGLVEEVMQGPANDVWVVRGARGEVLVPAVEQVVLEVPEDGAIRVDLPLGLVPGEAGEGGA